MDYWELIEYREKIGYYQSLRIRTAEAISKFDARVRRVQEEDPEFVGTYGYDEFLERAASEALAALPFKDMSEARRYVAACDKAERRIARRFVTEDD